MMPFVRELITFGLPHALRNPDVVPIAGQIPAANQYHYILGDDGQNEKGFLTFDCNGYMECFLNFQQPLIEHNTKARFNYANWCPLNQRGMLGTSTKIVPGMAVFAGPSEAGIEHVGVICCKFGPGQYDWLVLQAESPSLGFRLTKLHVGVNAFRYWGLMTKYFTYDLDETFDPIHHPEQLRFPTCPYQTPATLPALGAKGDAVKWVQWNLIMANFLIDNSGPRHNGVDGDFGNFTQAALNRYSAAHGKITGAALLQALGTHVPAVK